MQVDFFIAGVQKGGTTALDRYLRGHPSVQMAAVKELHFFDDETLDWSRPDYTRLHAGFDWNAAGVMRGEATPIYTYWPNALERLKQYNPAARIVVGLRHPAFRAHSHWRMESRRGVERLPFSTAIRSPALERVADRPDRAHRDFTYVERGFYSPQVDRLLRLFHRHRVNFLRTDRLRSEPRRVIESVEHFLEIDRAIGFEPADMVPASIGRNGGLSREDRAYLLEIFAGDIRRTAELTGLDLADWLNPAYSEPVRRDSGDA